MELLFFPDWLIGYANAFALLIVGHLVETETNYGVKRSVVWVYFLRKRCSGR